jgi:hypothetical protein
VNILIYLITAIVLQSGTAFKPSEDFAITFNYTFKQRTSTDNATIRFNETEAQKARRLGGEPLPFLAVAIKLNKIAPGEVKLKVIRDDDVIVFSKKVTPEMEFNLNLGFSDDIKDQISGYKHDILFYNDGKKEVSRITISFDADGNYFVNGVMRGKI